MAPPRIAPIATSDHPMGIAYTSVRSIFVPTNASTSASPVFR